MPSAGHGHWISRRALLFFFALSFTPDALAAQGSPARPTRRPVLYWGANVSTAAVSGWLQGRRRGASSAGAIVGGVAGGSAMYLGQRMVGTGRPELQFAGLQTIAVGASVARNLGMGRGAFSELTFPVFPLYIQAHPAGSPRVRVRVSAMAVAGLVHSAREFGGWPDWRASLVAGTPVYAAHAPYLDGCDAYSPRLGCDDAVLGHHVLGAIVYSTDNEGLSGRNILTHELGHVGQDVRDVVLHAVPASDLVLGTTGVGRFLARFVVLDAVLPLNALSHAAGPPRLESACRDLPSFYECETEAMMRGVP